MIEYKKVIIQITEQPASFSRGRAVPAYFHWAIASDLPLGLGVEARETSFMPFESVVEAVEDAKRHIDDLLGKVV